MVSSFWLDIPNVFEAVLLGDLLLRIVLGFQLIEALQKSFVFRRILAGIDDECGGNRLENMVILFVNGVFMRIVMT